jgi:hypothetical protein
VTDYRLPENRENYFTKLYKMNLDHGVMPGLVYLYMPELAKRFNWDTEQKLLFAFYNGMTQNPITSMRIMEVFPELPTSGEELSQFREWFNDSWETLNYDTDRRYQKKDTAEAVFHYSKSVQDYGSQEKLLTGAFKELWDRVTKGFHSFGRLAAFSYLEYIKIMGCGAECDNLFLEDKSGSKSHRNGILFLMNHDDLVWDKRAANDFDGSYNWSKMVPYLYKYVNTYLRNYVKTHPHEHAGYFTFESQCCQFKNGFFRRRYPGVYADMAWDRIKWYEDRGLNDVTKVFRQIREDCLPEWLREECESVVTPRAQKASMFADTGVPFRAWNFM